MKRVALQNDALSFCKATLFDSILNCRFVYCRIGSARGLPLEISIKQRGRFIICTFSN